MIFDFLSPATKLPWTASSGDNAMLDQSVPSTIVDPSKGTVTTQPASSSSIGDAGSSGGKAMIVRPPHKFGARKLVLTRAPT